MRMAEYYCPAMVGPVTAKSPTEAARKLVAYLAPRGASYISMETNRSDYEIHYIEERGWVMFRVDYEEGIDEENGGKVLYSPGEYYPGVVPDDYAYPIHYAPRGPRGFFNRRSRGWR